MHDAARTIRLARSADLEPLIDLARRSWLSAFAHTAPAALIEWWNVTDRTRVLYEAHWREMTVLEEEGEIIALVQPVGSEINGLWVRPDRQGAGAGSLLLRAGEDVIRRNGHDLAWLTCSAWNTRALHFYTARGYTETRREQYLHASGVEVTDVRMERYLGDSRGEGDT